VIVAGDARARIALTAYAVSLVGLFGVSALYHRINWRSLTARAWMRRLDHSMIFILIACSYTPFAVLVLRGPLAIAILLAVWGGAILGVAFNLLGWVAVAAFATSRERDRNWRADATRPRWRALHAGCRRVRPETTEPCSGSIRISRDLPHPRDRCRGAAIRSHRLLDRAGLSASRGAIWPATGCLLHLSTTRWPHPGIQRPAVVQSNSRPWPASERGRFSAETRGARDRSLASRVLQARWRRATAPSGRQGARQREKRPARTAVRLDLRMEIGTWRRRLAGSASQPSPPANG
jgi:hypothetical protein